MENINTGRKREAAAVRMSVAGGRRQLFVALAILYVAQAIPAYLMVVAALTIMRDQGVSRSAIGLVGLLLLPGLLRFWWAPLIDRFRPVRRAHRAGWIGLTQIGIVACLIALSFVEPVAIAPFLTIGLLLAVLLSTNDIAVDGYAATALAAADRPIGNAIQGAAVAAGMIIGGSGCLVIYPLLGWQATVLIVAVLSLAPLVALLAMDEVDDRTTLAGTPSARPALSAFFRRPEARQMLIIALVYRCSEGLVQGMEGPYLVDNRVPLDVIGYLTGVAAATAGLAGSAAAALLLIWRGYAGTLTLLGLLRTLCYVWFALHGYGLVAGQGMLFGAAFSHALVRYMEMVALFSLFMGVASRSQPGTDFSVLSSAQMLVFLIGTLLSGVLADRIGYGALFALAAGLSLLSVGASVALLPEGKATRARLS